LKQLLDNALKYSLADTPVAIRVRAEGQTVSVEVVNQGAAIAPEDLGRIFDRFYRADSVRDRIPGSGLGLTIASSIARAHGGDVRASSHPGETACRLVLPCQPPGGPNA
jgi:signal transduction histidine kinase